MNGIYILKNKKLKRVNNRFVMQTVKSIDAANAELVLECAVESDVAVNKIYVCYSIFGNCQSKVFAQYICDCLNQNNIYAQVEKQNILTLFLPNAPSIKLCGTLTSNSRYNFEHIVAESVARLTSVCSERLSLTKT